MAIREDREYRSIPLVIEERAEEEEKQYRVEGYASTFQPYELYKQDDITVVEKIDRNAFDGADMSDVVFLIDHEGHALARQRNGSLVLSVDDGGLKAVATLNGSEEARQAHEAIQSGLYDQMSFAFTVEEDSIERSEDRKTVTRIIKRMRKLYDVSAVQFPANPTTAICARSASDAGASILERAERLEAEQEPEVREEPQEHEETTEDIAVVVEEMRESVEEQTIEVAANEPEEREAECEDLEVRKAQAAQDAELREKVANDTTAPIIKDFRDEYAEERKNKMDRNSVEYRNAFFAMLNGTADEEQRGIFADNTSYGDGVALPVATDTAIWDQVHTAHPILADISTIRSGMVLKVTKSTPAAISKKKDSDTNTEQTMTNVDVVLSGADYHTYVTLSYAEAKMSQGAFEAYLVNEIANAIGEALAKDVFARILSDATTAQKVTAGTSKFQDIQTALGKATLANNAVIYAKAADYYAILGEVDSNGQPVVRDGVVLGAQLKKDNAATKITIVDPAAFVLNVVQDTVMESVRDVKEAAYVIGGYMRAEGCLRKPNAAAYID